MTRVFVTNITKDEKKHMVDDIWLHEVICDCTIEHGVTEKQTCRIFSNKEYADVMSKGYYEIKSELEYFIDEMTETTNFKKNRDKSFFFHIARYSSKEPFWTVFACKDHSTMCGGHLCLDKKCLLNDVLSALAESGWRIEVSNEFYFD